MEKAREFYDLINAILQENFGELGPLLVVGVLGVFLILLTLPVLLKRQKDMHVD